VISAEFRERSNEVTRRQKPEQQKKITASISTGSREKDRRKPEQKIINASILTGLRKRHVANTPEKTGSTNIHYIDMIRIARTITPKNTGAEQKSNNRVT
jgi:hypothetical protein